MTPNSPSPMTVHVGLPKAASTWLQTIVLPQLCPVPWGVPPWKAATGSDPEVDGLVAAMLQRTASRDQVLELIGRRGPILVSSETFIMMPMRAPGTTFMDPAESVDYLARTCPAGTRILMMTRSALEIRRSAYTEYVRMGGFRSARVWARDLAHPWLDRQEEIARLLRENFPTVDVLRFEDLRSDDSTFSRRLTGVLQAESPDRLVRLRGQRSNESPVASRRHLARALNRFHRSHLNPDTKIHAAGIRNLVLRLMTVERNRSGHSPTTNHDANVEY